MGFPGRRAMVAGTAAERRVVPRPSGPLRRSIVGFSRFVPLLLALLFAFFFRLYVIVLGCCGESRADDGGAIHGPKENGFGSKWNGVLWAVDALLGESERARCVTDLCTCGWVTIHSELSLNAAPSERIIGAPVSRETFHNGPLTADVI